jgi:hypothetical protein
MTAVGTRPAVLLGLGVAIAAYLLSFFHRVAPAAISATCRSASPSAAPSSAPWRRPTSTFIPDADPHRGAGGHARAAPHPVLGRPGGGVGAILFGLAPSFELAFVGRTLVGLGVSVTFIAMLKLLAMGFDERRFATLTGLCMLIGNLGSILAGAPLAWATQAAGWRQVFVVVGLLSFALAFASRAWVIETPAGKSIVRPG